MTHTIYLAIDANPDASVACDMTAAADTPAERLAEYSRLFEHALVGRVRRPDAAIFRFAAKAGVAAWITDLAAREAACCPFLTYRITGNATELEWHTSGDPADTAVQAMLDEWYAAPDWAQGGPDEVASRLEARGFRFVGRDGTAGYPFDGTEITPATSKPRGV